MEYKELKTKSVSELHKILAETQEKFLDLKFKVNANQLKNIRELRVIKKLIAQIKFLINQANKSVK